MVDTLTVIAYLLGHDPSYSDRLRLKVLFPEKQTNAVCVKESVSPQLKWRGVPPAADSLALVMHDKKNYYWVAYNLPVQAKGLPKGVNKTINTHDEGVNSFGENSYHSPWSCGQKTESVVVELYALDKRFSADRKMSGDVLLSKLKDHVLAKTEVHLRPQ